MKKFYTILFIISLIGLSGISYGQAFSQLRITAANNMHISVAIGQGQYSMPGSTFFLPQLTPGRHFISIGQTGPGFCDRIHVLYSGYIVVQPNLMINAVVDPCGTFRIINRIPYGGSQGCGNSRYNPHCNSCTSLYFGNYGYNAPTGPYFGNNNNWNHNPGYGNNGNPYGWNNSNNGNYGNPNYGNNGNHYGWNKGNGNPHNGNNGHHAPHNYGNNGNHYGWDKGKGNPHNGNQQKDRYHRGDRGNSNRNMNGPRNFRVAENSYYPAETNQYGITTNLPGNYYAAPAACSDAYFSNLKNAIRAMSFSSDKLAVAKKGLGNTYVTTSQVKELMNMMTFESEKLELAKYAYSRTIDQHNFYTLNSEFSFSSSVSDLYAYID